MKIKSTFSTVFFVALLSACVSAHKGSDFTLAAAAMVAPGMTTEQVVELLGPPSHKSSRVGDEVWVWANYDVFSKESRTATVIFVNGRAQPSPVTGKPVQ